MKRLESIVQAIPRNIPFLGIFAFALAIIVSAIPT